MKRMFSLLGMATLVLLLTASCKKEEKNGMKKITFNATIEQTGGKHYIDLLTPNSTYNQYWSEGDVILVNGYEFKAVSVDNPEHHYGYSTFEGQLPEGEEFKAPYHAFYPSSVNMFSYSGPEEFRWTEGDICITYEYKDEQYYVENSFDPQAAPMAGVTDANNINFQNLYNLLEIDLYSGETNPLSISKLKLTSKKIEEQGALPEYIVGEVTYNQTSGAVKYDPSSLKNTIDLICSTQVTIPTNSEESVPFFFVIPKCMMAGFTLEVYTQNEDQPYATLNCSDQITITENLNNLVYFRQVPVKGGRQTIQGN